MRNGITVFLPRAVAAWLMVIGGARAAEVAIDAAPPDGVPVLTMPANPPPAGKALTWEKIDVDGQPFKTALRGNIPSQPVNAWDAQLTIPVTADVAVGDVLLAELHVRGRAAQSPEAIASFVYESAGGAKKSIIVEFSAAEEWKTLFIPFEAAAASKAGQAQVALRLGFAAQSLDLGNIQLLNYGRSKKISELPVTRFTYVGRELDAPWRKAADERIERIRKGDLSVEVVDAKGKPVAGAAVSVNLLRHTFKFGTAVSTKELLDEASPDGEHYRRELLRLFNTATPDNGLKWPALDASTTTAVAVVDWLRAHDLRVRGHNLIWPSWKGYYIPARVKDGYFKMRDDPTVGPAAAAEWLRKQIEEHITKTASLFAGKVVDWDVVNEPYSEHDLIDILGPDAMASWYRLAKNVDPTARMVLNDYGILSGGGLDTKKQDFIFNTAKSLLDAHAPLDGLGFQGHFGWTATPPEKMLQILDRYYQLGLRIEITEFDMPITDEQLQADFTRDLLTVVFSHPGVDGFVMWGFWQKAHWKPAGAMFRADWSPKPNLAAYESLVLKKWSTHEQGKTDDAGKYASRAFLGEYVVTATLAGKTAETRMTLGRGGDTARIVLP